MKTQGMVENGIGPAVTQKLCPPCPGNGPWLQGKKDPLAHAVECTADQREQDFGILPYPKAN